MTAVGFVALAGLGTLVRWQVGTRLPRPIGTLVVNCVGAFVLAALLDQHGESDVARGVGGIGALTTFSTLVDELAMLWATARTRAVGYGAVTVGLGVSAAYVGLQIS